MARGSRIASLVVCVCCLLPLGWLALQFVSHPSSFAFPDAFQLRLLGRTLLYNGAAAVIATVVSLPAALVLGRGRGWVARVAWFALPVSLLMPSLAYAYGWKQFLRLCDIDLAPAGPADVARCVLTLAGWLWPVAGGILGLSLRRIDVSLQQQALLDGALWRVTARQLAGPLAASLACVTVLASQEFAVYEPTGISVVATEVRMVFETGLYSSPTNPITAPMGPAAPGAPDQPIRTIEQPERAAGAVATALPLLVLIGILGAVTAWGARRLSAAEELDIGPWPRSLDAGIAAKMLALLAVAATLGVPTWALLRSLHRRLDPVDVFNTFSPQIAGTLILATLAGVVALVVAFSASVRGPSRWAFTVSLLTFLLGGQLLAIALIRLYNRPALQWIYDAPPIVVMAYFARFGWLALLAAAVTTAAPWRAVRDMAALDGASDLRAAAHVVWPLAWPLLGASAVLVMVLSLTEVPATVLISPLRPQPLVPMLMTWVHMLRYDDMIEASLLLMSMVFVLGIIATGLVALGVRTVAGSRQRAVGRRNAGIALSCLLPTACCLLSTGCRDRSEPEAVWLRTGPGPGQVVYPRCIDYSPADDTFFVVDRLARIQHFDHDGRYLNEWTMPDSVNGKPTGVTVGPDGNVYLPDTHYQRVMVYDKQGREVRRWGSMGRGPGQFIYPTDVAFDDAGHVFVSEYGDNDRIQVFDREGKYLYEFGKPGRGPGELSRPQSMVIDHGLVYVTDACNHRIAVFKTDGTFVRNMGSTGGGLGQFRFPYGLAEDRDGHLVVCEFGNNRVQLVDKQTGMGLKTWGLPGTQPGELRYPWAVAVDKRGRIITVDSGNNRLQVFEF